MQIWFRMMIFSLILSLVKASNFIRVVVMAGLGLAGLWMMHTLAQDFQGIMKNGFGSATNLFGAGSRGEEQTYTNNEELKVFKRSINDVSNKPQINWDVIIKRDPVSCARSFICQLQASKDEELTREEKIILNITKLASNDSSSMANEQLQEALRNGETVDNPWECMKLYRFCPYTKKIMMTLLTMFGN
ncbi:hypothetical protein GWI33_005443 [Rhynchophorus ferrugineus]|uniref:Uncharacterized protein n=1 Tax=Rhynchophorus ferrugineus TaxID=354439 RepID=A0A834IVX9_RHYFE|nr:hypothetical protein GWI33_005443 [Rhynchophorus ferrugineus]